MLLALDSSTAWMGVCLYDEHLGGPVEERVWHAGIGHCEQLIPAIDALLRPRALAPRDLSAVAVAIGPGTFNGVRVGVATAKLIARAVGVPILAVGTLALYVAAVRGLGCLVRPVLGAARGEIATALWRADPSPVEVEPPRLARLEEVIAAATEPTLFVGELTPAWRTQIEAAGPHVMLGTPAQSLRRPSFLAELAVARLARGESDDVAALAPLYLRPPHITPPRR